MSSADAFQIFGQLLGFYCAGILAGLIITAIKQFSEKI